MIMPDDALKMILRFSHTLADMTRAEDSKMMMISECALGILGIFGPPLSSLPILPCLRYDMIPPAFSARAYLNNILLLTFHSRGASRVHASLRHAYCLGTGGISPSGLRIITRSSPSVLSRPNIESSMASPLLPGQHNDAGFRPRALLINIGLLFATILMALTSCASFQIWPSAANMLG